MVSVCNFAVGVVCFLPVCSMTVKADWAPDFKPGTPYNFGPSALVPKWSEVNAGEWTFNYEGALAKAKAEGKYTLLLFAGLFASWLLPLLGVTEHRTLVWLSGFLARLISSVVNFTLNKAFVFKMKGSTGHAALRYALLCVLIICLSNLGVQLLTALGMARWIAKLLCDTLLYFVSYNFQNRWVFSEKGDQK